LPFAGFIHVYRLLDGGKRFSLVHKTQVEGVPTAICGFQGRLLVGIGKMLRIYDLGKRKLLRKCENKSFPHCIQSITTQVRIFLCRLPSIHACVDKVLLS
jgi:splicing factor 3B subunit 3